MSDDDIEWLARKIHATGGTPDRLAINPASASHAPELWSWRRWRWERR